MTLLDSATGQDLSMILPNNERNDQSDYEISHSRLRSKLLETYRPRFLIDDGRKGSETSSNVSLSSTPSFPRHKT